MTEAKSMKMMMMMNTEQQKRKINKANASVCLVLARALLFT